MSSASSVVVIFEDDISGEAKACNIKSFATQGQVVYSSSIEFLKCERKQRLTG